MMSLAMAYISQIYILLYSLFAKDACHERSTGANPAWLQLLPNLSASMAQSLLASSLAAASVDKAHWELKSTREKYTCTIVWAENALELNEVSSPVIKHMTLPLFIEVRWLLVSKMLQQPHMQVIRNGATLHVTLATAVWWCTVLCDLECHVSPALIKCKFIRCPSWLAKLKAKMPRFSTMFCWGQPMPCKQKQSCCT